MKRLLKLGAVTSLGSIVPVLCYIILGLAHGSELTSSMIYTYSYQFVFLLLAAILVISQCKYQEKYKLNTYDYGKTGCLLFLFISLSISIVSVLNVNTIGSYLGVTTNIGKYAFAYGLISMSLDWTAYYIADVYYYAENDKEAKNILLRWYIDKLVFVFITLVPWFDYKKAVIFLLVTSACNLIRLIVENLPNKLRYNPKAGIMYSMEELAYDSFMILIYVFGIHDMSVQAIGVLSAYNMMTNCTDTQWDLCSVVDIVVTNEYCNGTYDSNKNKMFRDIVGYGLILFTTSIVMLIACGIMFPTINMHYVLIMFILEMVMYIPNMVSGAWVAYCTIAYPTPRLFVITLVKYIFRFIVQLVIVSLYSVSIATMISMLLGIVLKFALYKYCRRKVMGALVDE